MKKKYVIEFGIRGGAYSTSNVLGSLKAARTLAASLVHVLSAKVEEFPPGLTGTVPQDWEITEEFPRQVWVSSTHFVALSLLDGVPRGPVSVKYWKKPKEEHETYMEQYGKYSPLFD